MAVLVTGGAGYIGSHMTFCLGDAGEDVVVLDNLSTGFDWAIDPRAVLVEGNAADTDLVARLIAEHGIEAILHFAGSIVVPESVVDPLKYYRNNTAASRNLIEAAVAGGVKRFIFSSTAAVYGIGGLEPVGEDHVLAPLSPYGRSKLMTELMLADVAAAHPLRYGVLRYFNVAGADPAGRTGQSTAAATHLIKAAAQVALGQRGSLAIYGTDYPTPDGTGVRDYIHVTDLVEAHRLLLGHLRAGGESVTMNCGYGRGYSVREVVECVRRVSGVDFAAEEQPRRAGDVASVVARADTSAWCSAGSRRMMDWTRSSAPRSTGSAICSGATAEGQGDAPGGENGKAHAARDAVRRRARGRARRAAGAAAARPKRRGRRARAARRELRGLRAELRGAGGGGGREPRDLSPRY